MGGQSFFSVREAAEIIGGAFYPKASGESTMSQKFRVDSREIEPGDVFIAVRGANVDGHDYIPRAVEAGVSAIIASKEYFSAHEDELKKLPATFLVMPDDEKPEMGALLLAREWLNRVSPKIVGITGSVGKTTTRQILAGILSGKFRTHAAEKSYNTLIGCSMTILSMPADAEVLILELGTNHPGEISELVSAFPPTHAIITEISPAHLEGLKSVEGVLRAKMEITESKNIEFLSYNNDNDILREAVKTLGGKIETIGVGTIKGDIIVSDIRQKISPDASPRLEMTLVVGDEIINCAAPIYGRQNAFNIAFAYSIAHKLELGNKEFAAGLETIKIPAGRGGVFKCANGCMVIDDSYNANPDSVSHALKNLLELDLPGDYRKIAILGGMRELGDESNHWHEVVMSRASLLDEVYLIGEEWNDIETQQAALRGKWADAESFATEFAPEKFAESVVLIKGSRYYALEKLLKMFGVERKQS